MSENKKMRFEESRSMHTRTIEQIHDAAARAIQMEYESPMDIDPSLVPHGYRYSWKRLALFKTGEFEDSHNVAIAMKKGWTPVPAERHPELRQMDFLGRNSEMNGYIHRGNSLLMERTIDLDKLEWEQINKKSNLQASSIAPYVSGNPYFQQQVLYNETKYGI